MCVLYAFGSMRNFAISLLLCSNDRLGTIISEWAKVEARMADISKVIRSLPEDIEKAGESK